MYHYIIILSTDSVNYFVIKSSKGAWDKNHFGFLLHAQKLINGGNRSNSFGNKPKFSKNYRTIFGNSFLFLGVKHFYPDLFQLN